MIDFLLNANWILVLGFVGGAACLLHEFLNGSLMEKDDWKRVPHWWIAQYDRRKRERTR